MKKRVDYVVAIALKKKDSEEFLVVKRPIGDEDFANHWGLPAATMKEGELPEDCAKRVCREKLNCEGIPKRFLGIMYQKRNAYNIFLMDVEMELVEGTVPDVNRSDTKNTDYTEQKWTTDPMDLMPSAVLGSCCASVFLQDRGLLDREKWVESLEGSTLVG